MAVHRTPTRGPTLTSVAGPYSPTEGKQLSHSDPESPSRSVSKILFVELDILCDLLRDLEAKIEERLAPILRPLGCDVASPVHPEATDFSPLFNELFIGIRAAQVIACRNHDLIDRVEPL